jgi:hypothetical protein
MDSLFNTHLQSVLRQQVQGDASGIESLFRRPSHSIFRGQQPGFLQRGGGWAIPARGMAPIRDGGYSRENKHVKEQLTKSLVEGEQEGRFAPANVAEMDQANADPQRAALAAEVKRVRVPGKTRRITADVDAGRAAQTNARVAATYNRETAAKGAAAVGRQIQDTTVPVESKASDASIHDLVNAGPPRDRPSVPSYLVDTGDGKPPLFFRRKAELHKYYGKRHVYENQLGGITSHQQGATIQLANGHFVGAVDRKYADMLSVNNRVRLFTRNIEDIAKSVQKTKKRRQARGGKAQRALDIPAAPTQTPTPKTRARPTAVADELIPWQMSPERPSRKHPII